MNNDIRRIVLSHLGSKGENRFAPFYLAKAVKEQAHCTDAEIWEALWSLVGDGLIYLNPGNQGSGTDNWRWRLSEDGKSAADGGSWEPRDPDGYLNRLRRGIPNLDELVELYLTEALQSFNGRCYLATSVMLGVAAERSFHIMAQNFAQSPMPGAEYMAKELVKPRTNYSVQWLEFRKRIESARKDLPDGLDEVLTMDAIGDLIRLTRNQAGHPTGSLVDEETARAYLTIAPLYLKKMNLLAEHFEEMVDVPQDS